MKQQTNRTVIRGQNHDRYTIGLYYVFHWTIYIELKFYLRQLTDRKL